MTSFRMTMLVGVAVAALVGGCDLGSAGRGRLDPRNAHLVGVDEIGPGLVRFTFRAQIGGESPLDAQASSVHALRRGKRDWGESPSDARAAPVRVMSVRFNDSRGRRFAAVDCQGSGRGNVYTFSAVAGAVPPDSGDVICQMDAAVGAYRMRMGSSAYREPGGWRAEPRSFAFQFQRAGG